jgi:hypothetical protein
MLGLVAETLHVANEKPQKQACFLRNHPHQSMYKVSTECAMDCSGQCYIAWDLGLNGLQGAGCHSHFNCACSHWGRLADGGSNTCYFQHLSAMGMGLSPNDEYLSERLTLETTNQLIFFL